MGLTHLLQGESREYTEKYISEGSTSTPEKSVLSVPFQIQGDSII